MGLSNEIGKALEQKIESVLGGTPVPQSGGGKWFKSDVSDGGYFLWEAKATTKDFFRVTKEIILRARQAANRRGPDWRGGIITEVDGIPVVLVELADWADLMQLEPSERAYIPVSKAQERRSRGRRSL